MNKLIDIAKSEYLTSLDIESMNLIKKIVPEGMMEWLERYNRTHYRLKGTNWLLIYDNRKSAYFSLVHEESNMDSFKYVPYEIQNYHTFGKALNYIDNNYGIYSKLKQPGFFSRLFRLNK